jgi:hypothetical protein
VAHVQRPGGVGRDELDDGLALGTAGVAAEGVTQRVHLAHHLRLRVTGQIKIDEAGTGHFAAQDLRRGRAGHRRWPRARVRGGSPAALASRMATLLAKSPLALSRVRSTTIVPAAGAWAAVCPSGA